MFSTNREELDYYFELKQLIAKLYQVEMLVSLMLEEHEGIIFTDANTYSVIRTLRDYAQLAQEDLNEQFEHSLISLIDTIGGTE